ncbi:DUF445 domain-containing protein [Gibbsiella quercinecans]|uniref:DUF445 domain-containing protein n=1 Tax=Gibbsiella quercinecans TaxID=929813 RepID=A0A250B898_9GAMM|nr:DUF445 family protein [Gibbsiella quercinecans]ATA22460.1 hypothetical protein AWC35_14255 [Gibbsiella quercinecans]RLM03074.1 hypothetical protein BIY30_22750 [Gibbsiella quercinecans]
MTKETELASAKRLPLLLLCGAAGIFIATVLYPLWFPANAWISVLKAISEAAMVGALADWFAVSALFRRVPIPLVGRHTAIIPRNKNRIADNLALFVQDKFLNTNALLALIRRHDPAQIIANWLSTPANAAQFSGYLLKMIRGFLDLADDQRIQAFMRSAIHKAIDKVDLSQTSAMLLESLTKNNRHQVLLDDAIRQLLHLVNKPGTHAFIAQQVVSWLKREHPITEKMLPTDWVGDKSAELAASAVQSILNDIEQDGAHELRQGFNRAVQRLIAQLRSSPEMQLKAEEIKDYLKQDEALNSYISQLWGDLRAWLKADLDKTDSVLHARASAAGQWLGEALQQDAELRASLNQHMEEAATHAAPEFSTFLSRHISDTVKSWDARDMSHQVELNIGKDLQRIRINGTVVGGVIGLILYLLSQLPVLIAWVRVGQ